MMAEDWCPPKTLEPYCESAPAHCVRTRCVMIDRAPCDDAIEWPWSDEMEPYSISGIAAVELELSRRCSRAGMNGAR